MPRNGSGRIGSGRKVLSKHPQSVVEAPEPLYQDRKKYLDATNPVPSEDRASLYKKTTSTRHDLITPRTLKQSEIPADRDVVETQKCLEDFMEKYINKLVEEVGRRDSDFCSKNYLQHICAEVSAVLEKVRNWNHRDLSDSGSVLRKPESKSTPEWDYFVKKDREHLKDYAKKLSKAMDEFFFKERKFKVVVCTKADGAFSCLTSKEGSPFEQKYRFAFCLARVPQPWTAYDENGVETELETGDRLVAVSDSLTQPDVTFPRKRGLLNLANFFRDEAGDQILLQFNRDFSEMHIKNGGEHDATGWVPRLLAPAAPEVNDLAALIGESGDDLADLEISGEEELEAEDESEEDDDMDSARALRTASSKSDSKDTKFKEQMLKGKKRKSGDDLADLEISGEEELEAEDDLAD
jgi:hypothetical protein